MGIIKGLGKINSYNETEQRKRDERDNKVTWFTLGAGQSANVRFLQELDEDSPNYNAKNDVGFIAVEHQGPGPEGYKRKGLCTADEGDCYPCEQRKLDYENWKKASPRLYINVLVNPGAADEHVAVMSQGLSEKSITPLLMDVAGDEEGTKSITDRMWKISRKGEKKETAWSALPRDPGKGIDKSVEDYELQDLNRAVRHIPYDEQAEYYGAVPTTAGNSTEGDDSGDAPKNGFSSW